PAAVQRAAASATPPDPNLLAVREDAIEIANPAQRLRAVSVAGDEEEVVVRLETDGQVAKFVVTELRNPGRLALDLRGMKSGARHATEGAGPVKGVRVARRDDGVRVVLDSEAEAMPKYDVQRSAAGLVVRVGDSKLAKAAPSAPASPREAEALPVAPQLATVKAVDLRTDEGKTRVVVAVDHPVKFDVSRPDPTTAVLTLHGAALPERLERNLDATALGGPVTMLSSYRSLGSPGDVKIVASTRPGVSDNIDAANGALTWRFGGAQQAAQAQQPAA